MDDDISTGTVTGGMIAGAATSTIRPTRSGSSVPYPVPTWLGTLWRMDWSSVFDYSATEPAATEVQLADFLVRLFQPPDGQELAELEERERNLFPGHHPLSASCRPHDAQKWWLPQRVLPPSYLNLLAWSNGGTFGNGKRWFDLLSTNDPMLGVRASLLGYRLPHYMPGALPFAFNGGEVFYLFDLRQPASREDGEYSIIAASSGYLSWDPDAWWPIAENLEQACRGTTDIEDLRR